MYFANFPVLHYTLDGGETYQMMKDITVRTRIIEEMLDKKALYHFYTVSDESSPDDIATELYGDPQFHWVVLLSNDIVDPRMDWVWPESRVVRYTYEKYKEQDEIDYIHWMVEDNPFLNLADLMEVYRLDILARTHHHEDSEGEWVDKDSEGSIAVSNYLHEMRENDKKREIRVLDPRYLQQFLREFKRLMNE